MTATVLVINPHSANGSTARHVPELAARARALLGDVEVKLTESSGHATALTASALEAGAECVISVGGDGTNNEVVNGFLHPDGTPRRPSARFGFIPRGTGGDFRRTFGFEKDLDQALARSRGPGVPTDVGWLQYVDHRGQPGSRAYINVASAGLSGIVDKMVNSTNKALGPLSFFAGSLRGLLAFHPYELEVDVDGVPFHRGKAALCTAANGKFFGGGMRVAPAADVADGMLEVVCLPDWQLGRFALEARRLYAGDIRDAAGVKHTRGRTVVMRSPEEVLLDMDGEQPGRLPATFTVLPGILKVCR